jgi:hypothetical protein
MRNVSKKIYFVSAVALLFVLALGVSSDAREHWAYLGSAHVDGQVDHDSIHVGRSDGRFRAIQLRVSGGAIEFQRVVVHFGNGTQEELIIRDRIPAGGVTRAIDLPGERRIIERVELWYSKTSWEHRPKVSLFGIR